jgi:hypothetical protein
MSRFENVETSTLLDMLAEYTRQLTELFMKKDRGEQYDSFKETIQELQAEIQRRKKPVEGMKTSRNTKNNTNEPD